MKLTVNRKFSAAHRLNPFSVQTHNERIYGKCSNLHGHTWRVKIEVEGEVQEDGMIINFKKIKGLVDSLDHSYLNDYIDLPTAENIVKYFMNRLKGFDLFSYIKVIVWESEDASIEDEWRQE